jgi:outer membrane scaffolding protein for murein synthesis (MipA/OmpV family)
MYSPVKKITIAIFMFVTLLPSVCSADIARTLRNNSLDDNEPDNFLEIGVGVGAGVGSSVTDEDGKSSGLGLNLAGSYNWKGFFIDVFSETAEPVVLGYTAYNNDNWSFDIVLGTTGEGLSDDTDDRFIGLSKRESSSMLGGRLTGYLGKNLIQIALKHDVKGRSKGTVASVLLGRNWQYRNWNFHGLIGAHLADAKYNDYYLGVTAEESALSGLAAYDGETSLVFNSTLGVTYPISENWVYRATISLGSNFGQNDSSVFEKKRDFHAGIGTSISYVF